MNAVTLLAHVGLYVREAQERSIDVRTITIPMADVDRARIDGSAVGFLKVHLAGTSDRILGATIVGTNASEVISEFTLAIAEGIGLVRLGRISRVYPTYSAAILQAASAYGRAPGRGSRKGEGRRRLTFSRNQTRRR